MRVSLANSAVSFSVAPDQTVLDAALRAGLKLPHGCNGGNCGACRARLKSGKVSYPQQRPLGLSAAEAAEGLILLCQARALEDLSIEAFPVSTPDRATVKRLPCRIEHTRRWSHDVLGVFLQLPVAEPFDFAPGQYLDVMLSGGRRRSFSIASPPHDARPLELHVRRVTGGEWTDPLFADPAADAARKPLLAIEGPLGNFVYRADTLAPMLLVGGGTGLAPLKSILRHVIDNALDRDLTLYWGVRSERDLYAHAELEALAARAANLRYYPVLSEPGPDWRGRRGWVHESVQNEVGSLAGYDIYASGPPAMIAAIRREFPRYGADAERLFFDSFDYAPDTLDRQRTTAASKS